MRSLPRLFLAIALLLPPTVVPHGGALAANVPLPCTNAPSLTRPPETIRVLRTGSGRVELVPFKTYVYRTHVAEFWSEYKPLPYSDALLGVGAVAIKQNAWLWTRAPRDWWAASSTTSVQRAYVEGDYADDGQLNGSSGDPAVARLTRATNHATWALRMRIRFGADRADDGIGGLRWDPISRTYTAPLALTDESGATLPLTAETPRSCFDVTDHPSINQFYRPGGIYDPGYVNGSQTNERYNRAVDATWGITIRRWYDDPGEYRMWRPGFYGSFNGSSDCLLPPAPGESSLSMRHASQPSHWRGWSFFPMNAESCARSRSLSTEELLRASFFSWDGALVAGSGTSSLGDDRYRIDWLRPVRIVSAATDASGDGRGDLIAYNAGGVVRLVSADPRVDAGGRLDGFAAGTLLLAPGERLLARASGRVESDGGSALVDLRAGADGLARLLVTPLVSGGLEPSREIAGLPVLTEAGATLSLETADVNGDGVDELFLSERSLDPADPLRARLRLYRIGLDGSGSTLLFETSGESDLRVLVRDWSADGIADALVVSRDRQGTLLGAFALGSQLGDWTLGTFTTPGALLWPVPSDYRLAAADALGDGGDELYVQYRDPAGIPMIVRLSLDPADPASPPVSPDLVYLPEREPPAATRVLAGEPRLRYIAARTKLPLAQLIALNSGGYRNETIRPNDTYAKIAKRVGRSESCLRTMNANKVLYRGKTLRVPLDLCVVGASTVLYRGTPIRILAAETTILRSGESIEQLLARLSSVGVTIDLARLGELNPGIDPATAVAGTELRVRPPWAPVVRLVEPPARFVAGSRTLGWSAPIELYRGSSAGSPATALLAKEWTGDGLVDLFIQGAPTANGSSLFRLAYQDGRLVVAETIVRSLLTGDWSLR